MSRRSFISTTSPDNASNGIYEGGVRGPGYGPSLGMRSTATFGGNMYMSDAQSAGVGSDVSNAQAIGASGDPVKWWVVLVILMVVLMFTAKKVGDDGRFADLRMSFYNIFVISLASIIGITLLKTIFTKYPVPGFTALLNAV